MGKRGVISEIFNDKKSLETKLFFSVITKNSNWETLTKNLVIFKRLDGVKNEKLEYISGSLKNRIFRRGEWGGGGVHEKNNIEGRIA